MFASAIVRLVISYNRFLRRSRSLEQQSFEQKVQAMKDEHDAQKDVIASRDKTIKSLEAKNAKVHKDRERLKNRLYQITTRKIEDAKTQVMRLQGEIASKASFDQQNFGTVVGNRFDCRVEGVGKCLIQRPS